MLESQTVLFELRGSMERRYSTGISWSPDRQQSKNRTSLRRSRLDELRLEERNEARFLLEYLVCRLLLEKKKRGTRKPREASGLGSGLWRQAARRDRDGADPESQGAAAG